MAEEKKLTQVKIRNGNGNVTETIPVSVSVNNIKYDDNTSLKNKIDSLQLDTKLDKNLGAGKEGYFLALDEAGNIIPENLNTDKIKQSLHIPTDLSQFNNATKFVTEEDLKNNYSLEYSSSEDNTITALNENIEEMKKKIKNNTSTLNNIKNDISDKDLIYNKEINHFESFMQDVNGFYNLRVDKNADGHNLIPTALQIIENTDKISKLESKLATETKLRSQLESSFDSFTKLYQFKDIENKVDKIHYSPNISYVHFGDGNSSSKTDHMNFWGNTINRVAISATSTEDNRKIAILARLDGWKGLNLAEYVTKNGEETGTLIYNTQKYLFNETVTINAGILGTGYISNGGKAVYFFIPLPKSCPISTTQGYKASIVPAWTTNSDHAQFSIRTTSGYLNSTQYLDITKFTVTLTPHFNGVHVSLKYPNDKAFTNATNNTPISVQVTRQFSLTFKEVKA